MKRALSSLALALALAAAPLARAGDDEQAVYQKALAFLLSKQHEDGSFGQVPGGPPGEVGMTALAIHALARAPEPFRKDARPAAEKAAAWLVTHQAADGAFTMERGGLTTYRTALSISALSALDSAKHRDRIQKAAAWLKGSQFDEAQEKVAESDPHHGGFGYDKGGSKPDADMSNTHMALAALRDAGVSPDDPVFKRALTFLSRSQNSSETNPGVGKMKPKDDGGFIYDPGLSRNKSAATEHEDGTQSFESYASMTYAGLMSLLYAGVGDDDPRVKAAKGWIAAHYTLEENYGLGVRQEDPKAAQQGLFYYYRTFAKCLAAIGSPTVETQDGAKAWAQDLFDVFAARQRPDGAFVNEHDRWWESDPVLVTIYVVDAMAYAWRHLPE